ncbi:hypothetical protein AB1Y20_014016 [Prymnesium parvum]|uniref:Calmodulin n=1 Tax=Prymnesium parvum TaxID=97485 RepID=A0AB34IF99_PRYPA
MLLTGAAALVATAFSTGPPARPIGHIAAYPHRGGATRASAGVSQATQRYESMLARFREHSAADIELVSSPRHRALLRGASAAIDDEAISAAFRVLYEDIGPVRVAGDLIFQKIDGVVSQSKRTSEAASVRALGRTEECVVAARAVFDAVDADASGSISKEELLRSELLRSLGQCADCSCGKEGSCESVAAFMRKIDTEHPDGELRFADFLVASHQFLYAGDTSGKMFGGSENAEAIVDALLAGRDGCEEGRAGRAEARHAAKFDEMCEEFASWRSDAALATAQARNPRLALVLEGCFAGSANPSVLDALKILYVDFAALRLAGDLIFRLMRKLVK